LAADWSVMVFVLEKGKLKCHCGDIEFKKCNVGISSDIVKLLDSSRVATIEYLFPFYFYSKHVLSVVPFSISLLANLLSLNLVTARRYIRYKFFPNWKANK
jgi:hypothetical protein